MKWHKGPPPSVGWWPASVNGNFDDLYRYWDGRVWSAHTHESSSSEDAGYDAARKMPRAINAVMRWKDRPASWPARSRT